MSPTVFYAEVDQLVLPCLEREPGRGGGGQPGGQRGERRVRLRQWGDGGGVGRGGGGGRGAELATSTTRAPN